MYIYIGCRLKFRALKERSFVFFRSIEVVYTRRKKETSDAAVRSRSRAREKRRRDADRGKDALFARTADVAGSIHVVAKENPPIGGREIAKLKQERI